MHDRLFAVIALSLSTGAVLAAAPGPPVPTQSLYVSVQTYGQIQKFLPGGGSATVFGGSGLSKPEGLAFDSMGDLYVADYNNNSILEFARLGNGTLSTASTTFANNTTQPGSLNRPEGLAFDNSGNLYVANYNNSSITKFNTSGGVSMTYTGSGLNQPFGLAVDSIGDLYAANLSGNSITMFTPGGVGSTFATGLNRPYGLAFDSLGDLYASNSQYQNSSIVEFKNLGNNTLSTASTTFAGTGLSSEVQGLAFDSTGNLYVANGGNGTIEEFNNLGNGSLDTIGVTFGNTSSTASGPTFLALSPSIAGAPEPSEWAALGFTGLAVTGLLLRARKRQVSA